MIFKKIPFICLLIFLLSTSAWFYPVMAQVFIQGYVTDVETGKPLEWAAISIHGTGKGNFTDEQGYFSVQIDSFPLILVCSYIGYATRTIILEQENQDLIHIQLLPDTLRVEEVTISRSQSELLLRGIEAGRIELSSNEIRHLPTLPAGSDLFKAMKLMPGIQSGGEGDGAIYVRGGAYDQNLILLDGAPIYNPSHLLGFYSVFNSSIIDNVHLIKSGISPEYGNRISSVIESRSNMQVPQKITLSGNVGVLASDLVFKAPISKGAGMFYISGRSTYLKPVMDLLRYAGAIKPGSIIRKSSYGFYDLNAGASFQINPDHRLSLNTYKGRDDFELISGTLNLDWDMQWGNRALSLNWDHRLKENIFIDHTFYKSGYEFNLNMAHDPYKFGLVSGVDDIGHKSKLTWYGERHKFKTGIDWVYHQIMPNFGQAKADTIPLDFGTLHKLNLAEFSFFVSDEYKVSNNLTIMAGIRLNHAVRYGRYTENIFDPNGQPTDTIFYKKGEKVTGFSGPDIVISGKYLLSEISSVKLSFNYNNQYIHLVNASSVSFPTDFWVPSGKKIPPQKGYQVATGFYHILNETGIELSLELYYKELFNQSEFAKGILHSVDNSPLSQNLFFGKGISWGTEFLLRKNAGKWNGWLGYTFSKSIRSFPEIESGRWFPARYDRPHDFSLTVNYNLSGKWAFSGIFVYCTGSAYTPVKGRYFLANNVINIYGAYNSARLPDYHRLDLSVSRQLSHSGDISSFLIFSLYNVYNRQNPFFIYPEVSVDLNRQTLRVEPNEVAIFSILPSIIWRFSF